MIIAKLKCRYLLPLVNNSKHGLWQNSLQMLMHEALSVQEQVVKAYWTLRALG